MLGKDREMAILVAEKMKKMKFVSVLEEEICINMLFFKFTNDKIIPGEFLKFLLERNIKVSGPTEGLYRIMTHFYINEEEVE